MTASIQGLPKVDMVVPDNKMVPSKLYQQHREKGTTPSLDKVFDVLRFAIVQHSKVYIIVDAIDEYAEAQRRILLQYLAMMGPTVGVMITSGPHITADVSLPNINALEIHATEEDARRYGDAQITQVAQQPSSQLVADWLCANG
jgi:hypothetical protein